MKKIFGRGNFFLSGGTGLSPPTSTGLDLSSTTTDRPVVGDALNLRYWFRILGRDKLDGLPTLTPKAPASYVPPIALLVYIATAMSERLSDYDYELPRELIAKRPLAKRE